MWRSCLRLRGGGRHLLNCPRGGLTASRGPGPKPPAHARAYAPPAAERKRFYQNVSITQGEAGFEINLDHRKLRTPQAKLFTVPSEALAVAVATEWDSQQDTIKTYTMHLTTLCNTSLDNPTQRDKDQLIWAAAKFLDTDTVWSPAPHLSAGSRMARPWHPAAGLLVCILPAPGFSHGCRVEEPETLVELQRNEWDPVIGWAERRYGVKIGSSTSIMGPSIPARTREVLVSHLASYNMWALQGIEFVVSQLKSMVLTLGLIDLHLTVEQAVLLSRLEEAFQIQKWGNVEWAHDYELRDLRARTAAGALFVQLCSESSAVKHKLLQG
ncbi:ATP synthase mitochondrial F1 complex assembly factor 2 isoform X2 [Lagenorhynchus albirostris]|uniref:ATP synthase mitochondrial F1 complex assembly factor 2 isoform X1 n=1 Tax=Delphinus delphis TaxID=9728 RepID=UPI0028C4530F|nr:ATP synthase mitochondrial F1 complex assembly factor 2 isoform X1 [Delphinus delphis]XP_059991273.1 ATP synthase mitochondrial F1 complex assembly factor 2 isoform X2 [Lagenorhynchus albirostris]